MAGTLLHDTEVMEESHQFLADYLEANPGSPAECRVRVQPTPHPVIYEVWSDRVDPNYRDPEVDKAAGQAGLLMKLHQADVDAIAVAVAKQMREENGHS